MVVLPINMMIWRKKVTFILKPKAWMPNTCIKCNFHSAARAGQGVQEITSWSGKGSGLTID